MSGIGSLADMSPNIGGRSYWPARIEVYSVANVRKSRSCDCSFRLLQATRWQIRTVGYQNAIFWIEARP